MSKTFFINIDGNGTSKLCRLLNKHTEQYEDAILKLTKLRTSYFTNSCWLRYKETKEEFYQRVKDEYPVLISCTLNDTQLTFLKMTYPHLKDYKAFEQFIADIYPPTTYRKYRIEVHDQSSVAHVWGSRHFRLRTILETQTRFNAYLQSQNR